MLHLCLLLNVQNLGTRKEALRNHLRKMDSMIMEDILVLTSVTPLELPIFEF